MIQTDPITKQKNKLLSLLKNIKVEGSLQEHIYMKMYPTRAGSPKFYGLPKIYKTGVPLRPILSSRGIVSYETAKELARILRLLVGQHTISRTPWTLYKE